MAGKTLIILGATGLVGQQALQLALAHPEVARIIAPTRRPLPAHDKLENPIVDFAQLPIDAPWWKADAVICALGTTLRLAGSAEAFYRVDHDFVLAAALAARQAGTPNFALNSSLGARPDGSSFYLRVKGETENDLIALGFPSLTIVRPSLLDGGPRPDKRRGEQIALWVSKLLGPLLPRRIRPVSTKAVASALLQASLGTTTGVKIIESEQLR